MLLETNKEKPSFAIVALNLDSPEAEHKALRERHITKFKQVNGSYKGSTERAYVITFTSLTHLQQILFVGREFNQESILIVDAKRNAELLYLDTVNKGITPKQLGKFVNVSKFEALAGDNWTHDIEKDYYYIVKAG